MQEGEVGESFMTRVLGSRFLDAINTMAKHPYKTQKDSTS